MLERQRWLQNLEVTEKRDNEAVRRRPRLDEDSGMEKPEALKGCFRLLYATLMKEDL